MIPRDIKRRGETKPCYPPQTKVRRPSRGGWPDNRSLKLSDKPARPCGCAPLYSTGRRVVGLRPIDCAAPQLSGKRAFVINLAYAEHRPWLSATVCWAKIQGHLGTPAQNAPTCVISRMTRNVLPDGVGPDYANTPAKLKLGGASFP